MKYEIHRAEDFSEVKNLPRVEMNIHHGHYKWEDPEKYTNPDVRAWAQVGWNDEAFLVCLTAKEKEIRAVGTDPLYSTCDDSCLEFFLSPMTGDLRYFNIEFNPLGCFFLGFGENVETLVRLIPEEEDLLRAKPVITEDGWQISYTVPFSFIRHFFPEFKPEKGYCCKGNFYKCGDKTVIPHFYAWSPIEREKLTFHSPECFGDFELV